jgi:hypothetical protein
MSRSQVLKTRRRQRGEGGGEGGIRRRKAGPERLISAVPVPSGHKLTAVVRKYRGSHMNFPTLSRLRMRATSERSMKAAAGISYVPYQASAVPAISTVTKAALKLTSGKEDMRPCHPLNHLGTRIIADGRPNTACWLGLTVAKSAILDSVLALEEVD